jgi:hypothetical protein
VLPYFFFSFVFLLPLSSLVPQINVAMVVARVYRHNFFQELTNSSVMADGGCYGRRVV